MADDTTLFLADLHSLSLAISTFKNFEKFSGLKFNLNKTLLKLAGSKDSITLTEEIQLPKSSINSSSRPSKSLPHFV